MYSNKIREYLFRDYINIWREWVTFTYLFSLHLIHRCGVAGKFSFLCLSTVPVLAVMTINIVLYTLTWYQIRTETKRLSGISIS